jgi:hypothetical protein
MTDELELLRRHRDEPDPPSDERTAVAREALNCAIRREARLAGGAADRTPRRARRRLGWPARTAITAAIAVLVLAAGITLRSGSNTSPALAAPAVLERLAHVAASQSSAVPGPGQYLYTASRSLTGGTTVLPGQVVCNAFFEEYRQNWIASDGEGLFTETDGPPRYLSPQDAANCRFAPAQGGAFVGTSRTWAARGCLSIDPVPLGKLPTNPATLRRRLLTGKVEGGPPGADEAFTQVGDLLRETDASPALRAALYRAAAGLRDVKFLGNVTDKLGRHGLALAIDSHGFRHELIFSPRTAALLGSQDTLIGHAPGIHARRGTVLDWSAYLGERVVDRLPAKPPLPLSPPCVTRGATSRAVPGRPQDSVMVGSAARPALPRR